MAITDYQVTAAGDRHISVNSTPPAHVGRLVAMESTATEVVALLARGALTTTLTTGVHDVKSTDAIGVQCTEALTAYTVQAAGNGKISYNQGRVTNGGAALTTGASLSLDALDDTAIALVARGWIA